MSVYFLKARDLIKIGFSDNVRARVAAQIAANPFGCAFIGYMPGGRDLERHLHQKFADHRVRGEWFNENDGLTRFIADMALTSMPDARDMSPAELLQLEEQKQVEAISNCIAVICGGLSGDQPDREKLKAIAPAVGFDFLRLWQLYEGSVPTATAGELVILEDFMRRVNIGRRNGWNLDRMVADPEACLPNEPPDPDETKEF